MSSAPVGTVAPAMLADQRRQPPRQGHAARADADKRQLLDAAVALDDFVRNARERPADAVGIHHYRHGTPASRIREYGANGLLRVVLELSGGAAAGGQTVA